MPGVRMGPQGMEEQSLIPPWGSARASGQRQGLQGGHRPALEPRARQGQAAMLLCVKGSHTAPGKVPSCISHRRHTLPASVSPPVR